MPRSGSLRHRADNAVIGPGPPGGRAIDGEHVATDAGGLIQPLGLGRGLGASQRLLQGFAAAAPGEGRRVDPG